MAKHRNLLVPLYLDAMTVVYVEEWADLEGITREEALLRLVRDGIEENHPELVDAIRREYEEFTKARDGVSN